MKIWCGPFSLALLQSIVVLAHNNSTTDRHVKKTVSNSILHKLWKREISCPPDEYPTETHCCKSCNAGTYAQSHCIVEHGNPICDVCTEGKNYMDSKNGYDHCHKCLQCDAEQGQTELQACTVLKNTVCKCSENFFSVENRTNESSIRCQHCTLCEHGYDEECTATKDAVCKTKQQRHRYALIAAFLFVPLLLLTCYVFLRLCNGNQRRNTPSDPQTYSLPDDLKDIDLTIHLLAFSEMMTLNTVRNVVQKMGLSGVKIDGIRNDNATSDDQKYELLRAWYESRGRNGAFQELIRTLQHNKKQAIVEDLIQHIRSNEQQPQG